MPPPPLSSTEAITEVADRLFTAIENGDRAEVDRMWSPDIAVLRVIDWFLSATTERRYEVLDRRVFSDESASGFVQQHTLHATGRAGQVIAMRVCIVIKLDRDGVINRIDEYFDPSELAPLLD
ncbi:nuclear transport factor 2 family protein [Mycobacterium marinum]|uniref:nuclear transport factor 2 family protein n=1 Tax=Mycobacterium marinum TaxID=1781 RepID=UPI0035623038